VTKLQLRLGLACTVPERLTTTVAIVQNGVVGRANKIKHIFIMHPINPVRHQSVLL
jgi:hypothetical protein